MTRHTRACRADSPQQREVRNRTPGPSRTRPGTAATARTRCRLDATTCRLPRSRSLRTARRTACPRRSTATWESPRGGSEREQGAKHREQHAQHREDDSQDRGRSPSRKFPSSGRTREPIPAIPSSGPRRCAHNRRAEEDALADMPSAAGRETDRKQPRDDELLGVVHRCSLPRTSMTPWQRSRRVAEREAQQQPPDPAEKRTQQSRKQKR